MADQNQRISDLLDTLTDADSTEIETALRIFEPNDVAAVVAQRALAGGGGGGGSIAANSIWCGLLGDTTLTGSEAPVAFDAASLTVVGTPGFTLNGDTETWDCGTTGTYVIYIEPSFLGDATADMEVAARMSTSVLADPNGLAGFIYGGQKTRLSPAAGNPVNPAWTSPPLAFAAGDAFQVLTSYLHKVAGTGTLKAAASSFAIVRTA